MSTGIIAALRSGGSDRSSAFSKFFREASSTEKKKVFLDVAKKASQDQRDVMKALRP